EMDEESEADSDADSSSTGEYAEEDGAAELPPVAPAPLAVPRTESGVPLAPVNSWSGSSGYSGGSGGYGGWTPQVQAPRYQQPQYQQPRYQQPVNSGAYVSGGYGTADVHRQFSHA